MEGGRAFMQPRTCFLVLIPRASNHVLMRHHQIIHLQILSSQYEGRLATFSLRLCIYRWSVAICYIENRNSREGVKRAGRIWSISQGRLGP
jgi:hypothetical protein